MWTAVLTAIFLVIQGFGVWGAIDVIVRGRTAQGTVAWALALLLVPILALPLYMLLGDRKFDGYVRARRDGVRQIDQAANALFEALKPHAVAPLDPFSELHSLGKLARMPFTVGNSVRAIYTGEEFYRQLGEAIDQAKEYVLVQFYIIRDDEIGGELQAALLRARARGVRVMVLYDEIGSHTLPTAYLTKIRDAGGMCSGFRTKPRRQKPFRINFRNHRKIAVIDGRVGFTGGFNVGREYIGKDERFGRWRDTQVRLTGPSVLCLQLSFLEDWYWANRSIPDLNWDPGSVRGEGVPVLIVPSGPADKLETGTLLHTAIPNASKRRLWIATPYFVPDEAVIGALQLAVLRGVDVRVIIPEQTDSLLVQHSMLSYYEDFLPFGVRMFRYQPGFSHQKVMLCDDLVLVGSANLDNRSLRINFEISAVVADAGFAKEIERAFVADLEQSRELAKDAWDHLSRSTRFKARLSRLFAPIQ